MTDDSIFGPEGNVERMALRDQAKAVVLLLHAAGDALDAAKTAAEGMDAEQAFAHLRLIRPAARVLMAARLGAKNAAAAWETLAEQLPALYAPRSAAAASTTTEASRVGPVVLPPPAPCTACGGSRRTWDALAQARVACRRCKATGIEP